MQILLFAGLGFLVVAGLMAGAQAKPAAASAGAGGSFGLAMIFVLLTFGGWNEAAYLSGEVRDARRNMIRILLGGILTVTVHLPAGEHRLPCRPRPRRHEGVQSGRRRRRAHCDG